MVVGAFPLAKLGVLLIKQVSKPIAAYIKEGAKRSHVFRNYVCLPTAQIYNGIETRYKLWIMGFGKPAKVTPMNEQVAVELGADILGEVVIFVIAAGLLTAEYVRSSASSRKKEEAAEARLIAMESKLVELDLLLEQQRAETRKLERDMHASPFRALKDKLLPSSTVEPPKGDQKVVSGTTTISAPPGSTTAPLESSQGSDKTRGENGSSTSSTGG